MRFLLFGLAIWLLIASLEANHRVRNGPKKSYKEQNSELETYKSKVRSKSRKIENPRPSYDAYSTQYVPRKKYEASKSESPKYEVYKPRSKYSNRQKSKNTRNSLSKLSHRRNKYDYDWEQNDQYEYRPQNPSVNTQSYAPLDPYNPYASQSSSYSSPSYYGQSYDNSYDQSYDDRYGGSYKDRYGQSYYGYGDRYGYNLAYDPNLVQDPNSYIPVVLGNDPYSPVDPNGYMYAYPSPNNVGVSSYVPFDPYSAEYYSQYDTRRVYPYDQRPSYDSYAPAPILVPYPIPYGPGSAENALLYGPPYGELYPDL